MNYKISVNKIVHQKQVASRDQSISMIKVDDFYHPLFGRRRVKRKKKINHGKGNY